MKPVVILLFIYLFFAFFLLQSLSSLTDSRYAQKHRKCNSIKEISVSSNFKLSKIMKKAKNNLTFFHRVLCALVNSFVPETFTTEVLLNDRLAT